MCQLSQITKIKYDSLLSFDCGFFFFLNFSFTARIAELMQVLKDLNHGKYERTMVSQQEKGKYECTRSHNISVCWHNMML